ncbi:MAG TPA: CHASE3 domain-containing protein [Elusimicrobiota bacterium]|nr:CHASE3 domain-containing protein [Elusimicrobiota bacterium]
MTPESPPARARFPVGGSRFWIELPEASVDKKLLLVAAAVAVSLGVIYWVGYDAVSASRALAAQRGVIDHLDAYLSALIDAETGQRGYLLTRSPAYLAPYRRGQADFAAEKEALRRLSRRGALPAREVDELISLGDEKLSELDLTLRLSENQGTGAALAVVRTGRGKATMDAVRVRMKVLLDEQNRRLDEFTRRARSAILIRTATFAGLAFVDFLLLTLIHRLLARDAAVAKARTAQLEAAVAERTAHLEEALRHLESFSYTVAHDLRAPLRALEGFAFYVLRKNREALDQESIGLLERIQDSATRMDHLVRDLLALSVAGRQKPAMREVGLERVVDRVLGDDEKVRAARVTVRRPLGAVRAQESLLAQIVSHLLENAVKFSGRTPEIEVRSERPGPGRLRLVVADHGVGIAPEHLKRVFVPFVRLYPGSAEGTGIGLAIVERLAASMGGSAGAESELGKGSRFWIELPEA